MAKDTEQHETESCITDVNQNVNGIEKNIPENRVEKNSCNLLTLASTICLIPIFIAFGCILSTLGPCLVHLGYLFNANISQMALSYFFWGSGYIIGSLLSGLIFDRVNVEIQFFLSALSSGMFCVTMCWIPGLYWFYALFLIMGTLMSYLEACAKPYCIRLWSGYKYKNSIVQFMHGTQSLGYFIGPFIVRPFLVDLPQESMTISGNYNNNTGSSLTGNASSFTHENITGLYPIDGIERVRYPFIINGLIMCALSTTFLIPLTIRLRHRKQNSQSLITDKVSKPVKNDKDNLDKPLLCDRYKPLKIILLLMMFIYTFSLLWCLYIPFSLLPAYVIDYLHWPADIAPLITAVFTGAQVSMRVLVIVGSTCVQSKIQVFLNIILIISGFTLMLFANYSGGDYVMWISTVIVGLGTGPAFATILLWTSNYIEITGKVGAVFFVAGSLGSMVAPSLSGYMFHNYSPMWMVYLALAAGFVDLVVFISMLVVIKFYTAKLNEKAEGNENEKEEKESFQNLSN